jgi:hypothetical protein
MKVNLSSRASSNHQHHPSVILTEQMGSFPRVMANLYRCEPQVPYLLSLLTDIQKLLR